MNTSLPRPDRRLWLILVLLFGAAFLNYVDRQIVSVLKPVIKAEFGLDDQGYALLVNVFTFCYALAYMGTGWAIDRFGARTAYTLFLGAWSLATFLGGVVSSFVMFAACRALLGLAEPAHAPTTIRVGVLWFPAARRAFLLNLAGWGSTIGAILAPPLISWLALQWHWRIAFIVPGVFGGVLAVAWWVFYREPETSAAAASSVGVPGAWRSLWTRAELWGIVLARLISDPVWYFCLFWMPGYLQEDLGLSLRTAGLVGWIPFLAGNIGALICAALSDWRVRVTGTPIRARATVLVGLSCLGPVACFIPHASTLPGTLILLSIVAAVCLGWFTVVGTLVTDVFSAGTAASAWAIAGAFGATGAMVFNYAIGEISGRLGMERMFLILGSLHLIALPVLLVSLRSTGRRPPPISDDSQIDETSARADA